MSRNIWHGMSEEIALLEEWTEYSMAAFTEFARLVLQEDVMRRCGLGGWAQLEDGVEVAAGWRGDEESERIEYLHDNARSIAMEVPSQKRHGWKEVNHHPWAWGDFPGLWDTLTSHACPELTRMRNGQMGQTGVWALGVTAVKPRGRTTGPRVHSLLPPI
jgi:hypothetical protein